MADGKTFESIHNDDGKSDGDSDDSSSEGSSDDKGKHQEYI